jgi:hypothetical protein
MSRTLTSATVYCLTLFALGFVLGTIRVLFLAPQIGEMGATLVEVPVMLGAAFFLCRWVVGRWLVSPELAVRWGMAFWFLVLLFLLETLVGVALFGRTMSDTLAGLATPAGLIGLTAQVIAALLPLVVGRRA